MKTISTLFLATLLLSACNDSSAPLNSLEEEVEAQGLADKLLAQQELARLEPTDEDGDGYKTFADTDYGVSFDFPSDWIFEDEEGVGFRLSNAAEGTDSCEDPYGMMALYSGQKDASLSFDKFAQSGEMYDQNGGLGQMGGTLTETTVGGKMAYQAESTGWESFCNDEGYLVEVDAGTYLWIGLFTSDDQSQADELQTILDSLKID